MENAVNIDPPEDIKQNPHHLKTIQGNDQIKAHHADYGVQWEPWEEEEYFKCATDNVYFAAKYVKIINLNDGLVSFELYPYQSSMYNILDKKRFSIILAPRQSGKSIAMVIWLLWYALFHSDKTIVIAANKLDTAIEMLDRVKMAMEYLPFFLQPGAREWNKKNVVLSNRSEIIARATGPNTLRGLAANILYLDEFAFVENSEKFYTSSYPVIASGSESKIIITSTANGVANMYYKLWSKAVKKENDFSAFEVKWSDVPGRDEKWREETIARTSERQFMQEFENKFLGGANTLINGDTLLALQYKEPIFNTDEVRVFEKQQRGHEYVITADVSEGIGGDSSTFSVIDVTKRPFEQVAAFSDNKISPHLFSAMLVKYAKIYNNAYLCVENNDHGSVVNYSIVNDHEYENMYIESWQNTDKIGLRTTKRTKRLGCTHFKDLLEGGKLIVNDNFTIQEICKFEEKNGTYKGAHGSSDDLVMSLVLFGYLASTERFRNEFNTDIKGVLYTPEQIEKIQRDSIPPFGIIDRHDENGVREILQEIEEAHEKRKSKFVIDDVFGVVIEEEATEKGAQSFLF